MASLESLANPLERIATLPTTVNLRVNPITNSPEWNATIQYFLNDIVISPIDGGAYIWGGGLAVNPITCVLGGADPSDVGGGSEWIKFATNGVNTYSTLSPVYVAVAGAGATTYTLTVAGANVLDVPAGSEWLVNIQAVGTAPLALTAVDCVEWTVVGSGAGGTTAVADMLPRADLVSTSTRWASGLVVEIGVDAGPKTLTVQAVRGAGGQQIALSAVKITCIRLF